MTYSKKTKRAAYHASFKVILPYTYTWFIAKKNAWIHNYSFSHK